MRRPWLRTRLGLIAVVGTGAVLLITAVPATAVPVAPHTAEASCSTANLPLPRLVLHARRH